MIQLYDTMDVRFGVMLVGPTGGGKTRCYQTLQGALTRLRGDLRHANQAFQVRGGKLTSSPASTRGFESSFLPPWLSR